MNIVRDFNRDQGIRHPGDLGQQIRRDVNVRYASLCNSSRRPIGVAINNYMCPMDGQGPVDILFILQGGETKHLSLNPPGSPPQFITLLDPKSRQVVGGPDILDLASNSYVLRDGLNKWDVAKFKQAVYR